MLFKEIEKNSWIKRPLLEELKNWTKLDWNNYSEKFDALMDKGWNNVLIKEFTNLEDEKDLSDAEKSCAYGFDYDAMDKLTDDEVEILFKDFVECFDDYPYFAIKEYDEAYFLVGATNQEHGKFVSALKELDKQHQYFIYEWNSSEEHVSISEGQAFEEEVAIDEVDEIGPLTVEEVEAYIKDNLPNLSDSSLPTTLENNEVCSDWYDKCQECEDYDAYCELVEQTSMQASQGGQ